MPFDLGVVEEEDGILLELADDAPAMLKCDEDGEKGSQADVPLVQNSRLTAWSARWIATRALPPPLEVEVRSPTVHDAHA